MAAETVDRNGKLVIVVEKDDEVEMQRIGANKTQTNSPDDTINGSFDDNDNRSVDINDNSAGLESDDDNDVNARTARQLMLDPDSGRRLGI